MTAFVRATTPDLVLAAAAVAVLVGLAYLAGGRRDDQSLRQRLVALAGLDSAPTPPSLPSLARNRGRASSATSRRAADTAAETVADASSDAIRLRRALDTLPQAVVVTNERGEPVFRNARAIGLMGNRHGDALAAQAVDDLLAATAPGSSEERTLELYGPPRRTLVMRTQAIDNGQRALGVIAVIDDVSERRRLEEVRRDFVANVSHELKTPMGALGLLAETLLEETEPEISKRLKPIGSTPRHSASRGSSTTSSISLGSRARNHHLREASVLVN